MGFRGSAGLQVTVGSRVKVGTQDSAGVLDTQLLVDIRGSAGHLDSVDIVADRVTQDFAVSLGTLGSARSVPAHQDFRGSVGFRGSPGIQVLKQPHLGIADSQVKVGTQDFQQLLRVLPDTLDSVDSQDIRGFRVSLGLVDILV